MTKPILTHTLAAILGGCAVILALAYAPSPADPPLTDLRFSAPVGAAGTVDHLTAKVAPVLQQKLTDARDDIVANAGGPMSRTAVRLGFPIAVREVPTFTDHGIRAVLDEFGHYSVADLITLLDDAAKTKPTEPTPGSFRLLRELQAARP
jgi:hypothetical protein